MKKLSLICALFVSASVAFGETAAYSTNTFGMVKIFSPATNTLIAVPWVGYTPDALPTLPSLVDHLVKPDNLTVWDPATGTEGDMLLAIGTNELFHSWHLSEANGIKYWQPVQDVYITTNEDSRGGVAISNKIERGYGLWLIRRNPSEDLPIYLEGQYTTGGASVTIPNGENGTNSVMVAHPTCKAELKINEDIDWTGAGVHADVDTLSIPCSNTKWDLCRWDGSLWYCTSNVVTEVKNSAGQVIRRSQKNFKNYDLRIPAGRGFWYINRGNSPVNFEFK